MATTETFEITKTDAEWRSMLTPDGVAGHWRAQFDLAGVEGTDPVEMRAYLTVAGKVASETWLFQYHPF